MRWFLWHRSKDQDLNDEIEAHLAIEIQQRVDRGEDPDDAEHAARRHFGNVGLAKEVTRSMWRLNWLDSVAQDAKYAARTIRKSPGFALIAILTLALGIGANTAIFGVVDASLLRPLPFFESDRLVRIWSTKNGIPMGSPSPLDMRDMGQAAHSFDEMLIYDRWRKNVSGIAGSNQPEEMMIGLVPRNYFNLLRIKPLIGRVFTEEECQFGKHFVAAIGSSFWRTRFGGSPGILGRTLRINGETYSIVAVMPDVIPGWMDDVTDPVSIWAPFAFANLWSEEERGARDYYSLGRLKHGISYDRARSEVTALAARLAREHPIDEGVSATVEPLADTRAGPLRPVLLMLCAAVGMVLVIACANLASLLLARNSARYRELAVRAALGAGRPRLVRQLLLETVMLSLAGGAAGLCLAALAGSVLARLGTAHGLPYATTSNALAQFWAITPQPRILVFTLGVSVVTALLFGLAPAFSATRVSIADTLKEAGRTGAAGLGRQRSRRLLVITEVALSLVLVFAAGLLAESMIRLERQNPGFRPDHLLIGHVYIPPARYPDPAAITKFCDAFGERVHSIPGVRDASITTVYPPIIRWTQMFLPDGESASRIAEIPTARYGAVDAAYIRTLGLSVVNGRDFADTDTSTSTPVGLVNEAFARRYFPARSPLGHRVRIGQASELLLKSTRSSQPDGFIIVGVVKDFMNDGLRLPPAPQIFSLFRQQPELNFGFKDIVVRTAINPKSIVSAISRELRAVDPDIPFGEVRTMQEHIAMQTADTRFTAELLTLFSILGITLAVIGAYGVIAYLVAQRTQELGIRVALGAGSADILWLVLRQGLSIGISGVVLGLAGAMALPRLVARLLYGVSASDPTMLFAGAVLLLLAIATASAIPAMRAMRIDPVRALRGQ